MQICNNNECTACKVCSNICPTKSITFEKDDLDVLSYSVNKLTCINCNLCIKVCPVISAKKSHPIKAYIGWSLNKKTQYNAASGGIASELYAYFVNKGYYVIGAAWNSSSEVKLVGCEVEEKITDFRNSKYTYSDPENIYMLAYDKIKMGKKVLFIGLPCQVAAMKNYLSLKKCLDSSVLVDIICHGSAPNQYLKSHIIKICGSKKKISKIYFRDPMKGTHNYYFTLVDYDDNIVYSKNVNQTDCYQIGYHKCLIYRENCYRCKFTTHQRCGDLTLSDVSGLGTLAPVDFMCNNQMSSVLCNTDKGEKVLQKLTDMNKIILHERPIYEELNHEKYCNHPPVPHPNRESFKHIYIQTRDFDRAANNALRKELIVNHFIQIIHYDEIKKLIMRYMPYKAKKLIKKIIRGLN